MGAESTVGGIPQCLGLKKILLVPEEILLGGEELPLASRKSCLRRRKSYWCQRKSCLLPIKFCWRGRNRGSAGINGFYHLLTPFFR